MEEELVKTLLDYGLAGIVIFMLFKIVFNDLKTIQLQLAEISGKLDRLITLLDKMLNRGERDESRLKDSG